MNTLSRVGILSADAEASLTKVAGSLLNLFLRCYVGWQFFKSGMLKVSDWNATLGLFQTEYHVPLLPPHVAAITGATGELLFPTLLFIGFMARPAALGLLFVNIMAVISYPQLFKFECPAAINDHFYWGILLVVLFVWGPGQLAVDSIVARYRKSGPDQE
jgi:putative oxidoreductase